jgi:hypothetical protein
VKYPTRFTIGRMEVLQKKNMEVILTGGGAIETHQAIG